MPRPRKNVETVVKSFSIEKDVYLLLRAALAVQGRSVSEEVNYFMKKRLAELEGSQPTAPEADYETLKREYAMLVEDTKRYVKMLRDMGAFETMHGLAVDYGLDFKDMHNADEVIAKLSVTTGIPDEVLHTFISLLEVAKKKREVGRQLASIRLQKYSPTLCYKG
jgi:hypothetical protein